MGQIESRLRWSWGLVGRETGADHEGCGLHWSHRGQGVPVTREAAELLVKAGEKLKSFWLNEGPWGGRWLKCSHGHRRIEPWKAWSLVASAEVIGVGQVRCMLWVGLERKQEEWQWRLTRAYDVPGTAVCAWCGSAHLLLTGALLSLQGTD